MSDIKICDRCKMVFPEGIHGSSHIAAGIVHYDSPQPDKNLNGDLCTKCTAEFLAPPKGQLEAYRPPYADNPEDKEGE